MASEDASSFKGFESEDDLDPIYVSERDYVPLDSITTYIDDVDESKSEFDRRSKLAFEYGELFKKLTMLEAEYYDLDSKSNNAQLINDQYERLLDNYSDLHDRLYKNEYDRFLKGQDYYYETKPYSLDSFDVNRAFDPVAPNGLDMKVDINFRSSQEDVQKKRYNRMVERGGTMADLLGSSGNINRVVYKKAITFGHPVQSVQLNSSDKLILEEDLNNVEMLKEDGLISYLLYRELKGDVMLF